MKNRFFAILVSSAVALSLMPSAFADEVTEYDSVKYTNTCETEADGFTLTADAPDGTNYYSYTGTESMFSVGGLGADTSEDYMWEADVRFDANGAGFTVQGTVKNKKVNTCIRRYDESDGTAMLAVQRSSSNFVKYIQLDTDAWYHIQLIGQYGTGASVTMVVYKWENGEMTFVGEYTDIDKRNNGVASYISVEPNTSIDNVQITKLGADTLLLSTTPEGVTEMNAGSATMFMLDATRNGRAINNPAVEWKVFENGSEITDSSVTVSQTGMVTASIDCAEKDIVIKAISVEKGNAEAEYNLHINKADIENEKFDKIYLSADKNTASVSKPLPMTVFAEKNGESVELSDGDIVWKIYDEENIMEIGNRYITVTDNCLYVAEDVLPQKIIVRAESVSGFVVGYIPVTVEVKDNILASDCCEDVNNSTISSPSWDGSHFYNVTELTNMAEIADVNDEVIISMDIQFVEENSGLKLKGGSYEGGQISSKDGNLVNVKSGSTYNTICAVDSESWYRINIDANFAQDNYRAILDLYKYNADGTKTLVVEDFGLSLRTMAIDLVPFDAIDVFAGTNIDNLHVYKFMPDSVELSVSSDTVYAGDTVQIECKFLRKDKEIAGFTAKDLTWELYNEDGVSLPDDVLVTVDSYGMVTIDPTTDSRRVYVRATLEDNGITASVPIDITKKDIFTVTGIGLNADKTAITQIKVNKNFAYSGSVTFVMAVYDENGVLIDVEINKVTDNSMEIGENTLSFDTLDLPENFKNIKIMAWTSL